MSYLTPLIRASWVSLQGAPKPPVIRPNLLPSRAPFALLSAPGNRVLNAIGPALRRSRAGRNPNPRPLSIGPPDLKLSQVTFAPCHGRELGIRIHVLTRDASCFGPIETHIPRPREPEPKKASVPSVVNKPLSVIGAQRRIPYILSILSIHVNNPRQSTTITRRSKPAESGNVRK